MARAAPEARSRALRHRWRPAPRGTPRVLTSGIGRRRGTQFLPQLGRDPSRAATRIAGCKDNEHRSYEQACYGRRLIYPPAGLPRRGGPILCTPFRTQPGSLCCNISPPSPSTPARAQPLHAHVAPSSPARPFPRPAHDFPSLTQALRAGCAPFLFSRATALAILSVRRSPRCPNCRQPRGSFCGPSLRRRRSSPRSRRRARVSGNEFGAFGAALYSLYSLYSLMDRSTNKQQTSTC